MPRSLIALGANLGDRQQTLRRAVELLAAARGNTRIAPSGFHETRPSGGPPGQGAFLNAAVALDTTLTPEQLHGLLRRIEIELGRKPAPHWAARAIDMDLLLFDDRVVSTPQLAVPHPRMTFRRFVLAPAAEVASEMVHPLVGWTIGRLLAHLDSAAPYVAILGMPDSDRPALAQKVAHAVGGTYLAGPAIAASAVRGVDPSGQGEGRPLQFLDRAGALLAGCDLRARRVAVVSDFYLDECLACARMDSDHCQYEQIHQAWATVRQTVEAPKLLVVLDTWPNAVAVRAGEPQLPDAPQADRLRRELLHLATRTDVGPVLFAGRDDPQAQFEEITAAIAAME